MLKLSRPKPTSLGSPTTICRKRLGHSPGDNTILINRGRPPRLAELYQLRGRVGRSHHRAYRLPPRSNGENPLRHREQTPRRNKEFSELGAGFRIALWTWNSAARQLAWPSAARPHRIHRLRSLRPDVEGRGRQLKGGRSMPELTHYAQPRYGFRIPQEYHPQRKPPPSHLQSVSSSTTKRKRQDEQGTGKTFWRHAQIQ